MPTSIKIYPPTKLPDRNVNETQFNIWCEELEVYLSQEKEFSVFLPGEKYSSWLSHEINPLRIEELNEEDTFVAGDLYSHNQEPLTNEEADNLNEDNLAKIRKNLRTVLSIIGKCVAQGH